MLVAPRQDDAMVGREQAECAEGAVEAPAEISRRGRSLRMLDEDELAVLHLARDARKQLVVLWQVLEQRLSAPEHDRVGPQSQARPG